jgi:hypothetical protein
MGSSTCAEHMHPQAKCKGLLCSGMSAGILLHSAFWFHAPFRCLGLAYRAFMLASPAALAVAGAGAELSTALGKLGYRTFVDPALLTLKVCVGGPNTDTSWCDAAAQHCGMRRAVLHKAISQAKVLVHQGPLLHTARKQLHSLGLLHAAAPALASRPWAGAAPCKPHG